MEQFRNYVVVVAISILSCSVGAGTIRVPLDRPTIQGALDAASVGDTVLVAAGTYSGSGNRDLDFNGVNIVLMSEWGPDATIIDCGGSEFEPHRGLTLHNGEDTTSVIQGLTFTNAYQATWYDAAVLIDGANARVQDCIFQDNVANGLTARRAQVYVRNCIARNNLRHGFEVDGFYAKFSQVEAYNNGDNGILIDGGGDFIIDSSFMYQNGGSGMFIHWFSGGFHVSNCTFVSNKYGLRYDWNFPKGTNIESIVLMSDTAYIDNCIAAFNGYYGFASQYMVIPHLARCSDAFGNGANDWSIEFYDGLVYGAGDAYGNLSMDPLFCDTSADNFGIQANSPCAPSNNNCGVLIGARSINCPCCNVLTGNVDCDPLDGADISDLTALIDNLYISLMPLCCPEEANLDGSPDGNADISDLTLLIDYLYISFTPPAACQ